MIVPFSQPQRIDWKHFQALFCISGSLRKFAYNWATISKIIPAIGAISLRNELSLERPTSVQREVQARQEQGLHWVLLAKEADSTHQHYCVLPWA